MKRCKRCILPVNFPHVTFDKEGVCNLCREYKGRDADKRLKKEYRDKFKRLIKGLAGKSEYDVLMCYSGGKDSTYTLDIFKNVYKLKVLAFTLDNGFFAERAYVNIRNAVEKLDVDHIFFKVRFELLKKIFKRAMRGESFYPKKTLERASTICTSCVGFVKYVSLKIAIEKDIPFIGFGWSPGQAPITSSVLKIEPLMIKSMEMALKGPMSKIAGKDIEPYFLNKRHYSKRDFPIFIHPLAFLGYDEEKILKKIGKFGWKKPPEVDLNATNCLLNALADEVHIAKYGFHPYVYEIAKFVREGYMTRREGLKHIPFEKDQKVIRMVKKRLGV